MGTRLIIEGNAVYEIDEECQECSRKYNKEPQSGTTEPPKKNVRKEQPEAR